MEDAHKILEQIEAYLSGSMSDEERLSFENEMKNNATLKKKVEEFRMAQQAIFAGGRTVVKHKVDEAVAKSIDPTKKEAKVVGLRRIMAIAAAVLVLLTAGFWIWNQNSNASPVQLFATHFEMPPVPNVRSAETTISEKWNTALTAYNENDFQKYIVEATSVLKSNTFEFQNEGYLLLGVSYLQLNDYANALTAFEKVSPSSSSGQDAVWYTALTHLKNKDLENAKSAFQKIIDANHSRKLKAGDILKQLYDE